MPKMWSIGPIGTFTAHSTVSDYELMNFKWIPRREHLVCRYEPSYPENERTKMMLSYQRLLCAHARCAERKHTIALPFTV